VGQKNNHRDTEDAEMCSFSFAVRRRQTKTISPPWAEQRPLLFSPEGQVIFAHRGLPMGKNNPLCPLCLRGENEIRRYQT